MQWRGYVKDRLDLKSKPKAYLNVRTATNKLDLLTSANSSFSVLEMPTNVSNNDILLVYDDKGNKKYQGVIKSINEDELTIETNQIQSILKGQWVYNIVNTGTLEESLLNALVEYCNGQMKGSSYIDPIIQESLGVFEISYATSTSGNFETQEDQTTMDMETFIYDLYSNYQIILDIDVKYEGTPTIKIGKNTISELKVGDNIHTITSISPTLEIETTNRLIIYSKDGVYRTTYVTKGDGTRVEEPSDTTNRFNSVETKIVFSDDEISDLLEANLPSEIYNHKLTFTLLANSKIFNINDFKLGMPLKLWRGTSYYNTILTGVEFSKEENKDVESYTFTCGKVRTSLTKKLLMKYGVK